MAINLSGLVATIGAAENEAASAVNGLGANATAQQLTQATFKMNVFQMIATAVAACIKADADAKSAPARAISR